MTRLSNIATRSRKREGGQTLVIILLILFVLSTLTFVASVILGREIEATGQARGRNLANDLAQAGVRYCFSQLRFSEDGADWRPQPPTPVPADVDPTRPPGLGPNSDPENPAATNPDPDYYWLRRQVDPVANAPGDLGGPDGLGAFTRLNFRGGRALVRVRWAPSDPAPFQAGLPPVLARARLQAYTIIESVGRPGEFNAFDPTSAREPNIQNARQVTAIASIGLLESAYYVTNLDRRTEPIDFGNPVPLARFFDRFTSTPVDVVVPRIVGNLQVAPPNGYPASQLTVGGPMYFNADLVVHGVVDAYLNRDLGQQVNVAGEMRYADGNSMMNLHAITAQSGVEVIQTAQALPSNDPNFTTHGGVFRDGREGLDALGYPRDSVYKDPPLINEEDPNTGLRRFIVATRNSGSLSTDGSGRTFNLGVLGFGRGVYIDNSEDRGQDSEDGSFTLRWDYLNPHNGHSASGWDPGGAPFYVPNACYILLTRDGFTITRNIRRNSDTWRDYTRTDTGRHTLRFKVGYGTNPNEGFRIINELTPGVTNFFAPTASDFDQGPLFNGVIYCEGDVRIRGVIPFGRDPGNSGRPMGVQLTVASGGNIYVEGSITRAHPTRSTLALLAENNVVLNTTQFVTWASVNEVVTDNNDPTNPGRIKVQDGEPFNALVQYPLDPVNGYTFNNPDSGGNPIRPSLFVAHAADFNRSAFVNLLINELFSATPAPYHFDPNDTRNAAIPFYPNPPIFTYGLADPSSQVLPVFEKRSFPLIPINQFGAGYTLFFGGDENMFQLKLDNTIAPPGRGPYMLSRITAMPMDVEINAVLYAQNGSFFIIPGLWFNPNPNDRRDAFQSALNRFSQFSASPEYPFYGDPLDIKVTINGSVSENFPPMMGDQEKWLEKWGWIPAEYGASDEYIPDQHYPRGAGGQPQYTNRFVPNLFLNYDPLLMSGRVGGSFSPNDPYVRTDPFGRSLPPMPKLPVGTRLLYFGEVNP